MGDVWMMATMSATSPLAFLLKPVDTRARLGALLEEPGPLQWSAWLRCVRYKQPFLNPKTNCASSKQSFRVVLWAPLVHILLYLNL